MKTFSSTLSGLVLVWLAFQTLAFANPQPEANQEARLLEQKLQQQLEALVGPGKARVIVRGEAHSDHSQQRSITRSNPQPVAERTQRETLERNGQWITRESSQRSWSYDQTEELRQKKPSGLQQKSVSVIYEPPTGRLSADETESGILLDPAAIEDLIRSVANLDETRGDRLSIQGVRFAPPAWREVLEQTHPPLWLIAAIALSSSGLGAGLMFWWLRRRQRQQAIPTPEWQSDWALAELPSMRQPANGEGLSEISATPP